MNCGVALTPSRRDSSSTIFPIAYHSADLRRCEILMSVSPMHMAGRIPHEELHPSCQPSGMTQEMCFKAAFWETRLTTALCSDQRRISTLPATKYGP